MWELEAKIKQWHRQSEACRKIADIPGVGPITATAILASVGVKAAERKVIAAQSWLGKLITRRNKNVAALALANKNARIIWALLAKERKFRSDYRAVART